MKFRDAFLLLFLAGLAVNSVLDDAYAQGYERPPFAHEVSDLQSDARILYGELPNGLRYAVMDNESPE